MRIEDVQKALEKWGGYWARQRQGKGMAGVSITEQCCRIMRTGVQISGTAIHFSEMSDSIIVPDDINEVDIAVDKLNAPQKMYLRLKYIGKKRIDNRHIYDAHMILAGLI